MKNKGGYMTLEIILIATVIICIGFLLYKHGEAGKPDDKPDKFATLEQEIQNLSGVIHGYSNDMQKLNNLFININQHVQDLKPAKADDYSDEFDKIQDYLAALRKQQSHFNNTINSRIDAVAKGMPKMIEVSLKKIHTSVPIKIDRDAHDFAVVVESEWQKLRSGKYKKRTVKREVKNLPGMKKAAEAVYADFQE